MKSDVFNSVGVGRPASMVSRTVVVLLQYFRSFVCTSVSMDECGGVCM